MTAVAASSTRCQAPGERRAVTPCQARSDRTSAQVVAAVAAVNDPEYPDVSIVDLGLLESVVVNGRVAAVGLIPTFSGCPALHMIADDVRVAVERLDDIARCDVTWLPGPVWSTDRMADHVRARLADEYTVVVRRPDGSLRCPVCGSAAVTDQAMAGPTRCRSVAWCPDCRNPVEVMRADVDPLPPPHAAVPVAITASMTSPATTETATTSTATTSTSTTETANRSITASDTMEVCA